MHTQTTRPKDCPDCRGQFAPRDVRIGEGGADPDCDTCRDWGDYPVKWEKVWSALEAIGLEVDKCWDDSGADSRLTGVWAIRRLAEAFELSPEEIFPAQERQT